MGLATTTTTLRRALGGAIVLALLALGAAPIGACGSSPSACKPSHQPGVCAWQPCENSVADACAAAAHNEVCVTDWPADPASFCSPYTVGPANALSTSDCGSYRAVILNGADYSNTSYYDKATGKLVAIVGYDANFGTDNCAGGPGNFVQPSCGPAQPVACPDGGAGGAGGADAGM